MVFEKGALAVPLLDWLAVIFVEIEALFLRDVEILRDTLVESETLGMRDVEIPENAFLDTEAMAPRDGETPGGTIVETEALKVMFWLTVAQTREISNELNVHITQV